MNFVLRGTSSSARRQAEAAVAPAAARAPGLVSKRINAQKPCEPVIGFEVGPRDIRLTRSIRVNAQAKPGGGLRGRITRLSLWVLEFQERGAPHFHVFFDKNLDRNAVSAAWFRIVGSDDPKHLLAGTRIEAFRCPEALGPYLMPYAAKLRQKDVPEGFASVGRFWAPGEKCSSCGVSPSPVRSANTWSERYAELT